MEQPRDSRPQDPSGTAAAVAPSARAAGTALRRAGGNAGAGAVSGGVAPSAGASGDSAAPADGAGRSAGVALAPSLRRRLFVMILLPLLVLAVAVSVLRYRSAQELSRMLYDDTLRVVAHAVARDVMMTRGDMLADALTQSLVGALGDPIYYHVAATEGRFLTGYGDPPVDTEAMALPGGVPVFFDATFYDSPVRVVVLREFLSDPEFNGWTTVQVWQTVSRRHALSLELLAQSAAILGVILVAVAALVWFGIAWGLRPLTDLRQAVAQRSPDDLSPIRRPLPREVQPVVVAMNRLFGTVRQAIRRRDDFIANAAHQLRNPIAAIQAQAEAAEGARSEADLRARVAHLAEAARQASRLTRQLLSSDIAARAPLDRGQVQDMAALVQAVAARHVPRALAAGCELELRLPADGGAGLQVAGDAALLEEALENLVDNALCHGTGPGGRVEIALDRRGDRLRVAVRDTGPGIPETEADRVFDRFFRLVPDGRPGCGLGLAIVRTIAERHGGGAWLDNGQGPGACFVLDLPLAA